MSIRLGNLLRIRLPDLLHFCPVVWPPRPILLHILLLTLRTVAVKSKLAQALLPVVFIAFALAGEPPESLGVLEDVWKLVVVLLELGWLLIMLEMSLFASLVEEVPEGAHCGSRREVCGWLGESFWLLGGL
ncbi:hypothetical protein BU23DRAFT_292199 [Bimuria novae-zelandiae CBS 107.79]|uniref:Uncharacterized protein n=1 Tax=Bimuria novae-zelandiae CBS 107.79 TaxID=1447943 RepID=A0A6A5UUF3_9PLEO|nr:hypothetical protein BU23DRAFT_292199 [Bimuria novae-zelandiae CBS 107.79]